VTGPYMPKLLAVLPYEGPSADVPAHYKACQATRPAYYS